MRSLAVHVLAGAVLLGGCRDGGGKAAPPATAPPATAPSVTAQTPETPPAAAAPDVPSSAADDAASPKSAQEAAPSDREPAGEPAVARSFPPADFAPPFERSAQEGDGVWSPLGPEGEPLLVRTVVHPHEVSRFLSVHVVAVDLERMTLHYMPGSDDMGNATLPDPLVPGRIPREHLPGLVAAFNGGFMPRHGRWGMKAAGVVIVPPRESGCTVALLDPPDASAGTKTTVVIAPWPRVEPHDARAAYYRQTPPCLLDEGELHPQLLRGNEKPWGGFNANLVTRRRSAVGLDATGKTLFYAVGIEVGPRLLAEGLRYAGARQAAELDINDNWTRFALFEVDAAAGEPRVATMLLDDMVKQKSGYVARPSERDFFYLRRGQ